MIKAIILDLDGTLIWSSNSAHLPANVVDTQLFSDRRTPPDQFQRWTAESYHYAVSNSLTTRTLQETLMWKLSKLTGQPESTINSLLSDYFVQRSKASRQYTTPASGALNLFDKLADLGLRLVVAADPIEPLTSISRRLEWAGFPTHGHPFEFVAALDNMHFGKPHPEYFEEIMLRLALNPGEALMVGNGLEDDILGASQIGLATFHVRDGSSSNHDRKVAPSSSGSLDDLADLAADGNLESLMVPISSQHTYVHRLAAFPSSIDNLIRSYGPEVMECAPAEGEWSARDIICHFKDHEWAEDRVRLERILNESQPFLSGNYDPWAHAQDYSGITSEQAFADFASERAETVEWLKTIRFESWARPARHAIFGPTNFLEMVRFTTEHDLTHLRQMRSAIDHALVVCGEESV